MKEKISKFLNSFYILSEIMFLYFLIICIIFNLDIKLIFISGIFTLYSHLIRID